jgi:hypothetical protein
MAYAFAYLWALGGGLCDHGPNEVLHGWQTQGGAKRIKSSVRLTYSPWLNTSAICVRVYTFKCVHACRRVHLLREYEREGDAVRVGERHHAAQGRLGHRVGRGGPAQRQHQGDLLVVTMFGRAGRGVWVWVRSCLCCTAAPPRLGAQMLRCCRVQRACMASV